MYGLSGLIQAENVLNFFKKIKWLSGAVAETTKEGSDDNPQGEMY